MRDVLVKQMLDVRVYHYVRPDVKAYCEAVRKRPKGVKEREVRAEWLEEHKFRDDQLLPKPGWKRFGFPRSYKPVLLEAMLALAECGAKNDAVLDDALDHIEQKRLSDGRWKLDDSLNGEMLADIERKGQPSKWITHRSLIVLAHFRRFKAQRQKRPADGEQHATREMPDDRAGTARVPLARRDAATAGSRQTSTDNTMTLSV